MKNGFIKVAAASNKVNVADVDFNTKANIEMPWRIEEMNNFLPEDFRTKEEIIKCMEENQK